MAKRKPSLTDEELKRLVLRLQARLNALPPPDDLRPSDAAMRVRHDF